MDIIRLISAHFFMVLFFVVFREATMEIKNPSLDTIPTAIESTVDKKLEVKSNRIRNKSYYTNDNHEEYNNRLRVRREEKNGREPKIWDQWGNWSTCSVTCGIGKIIRWRHCISGSCSLGEKKAQLKTCTSAAC